jgi:protein TonB
VGEAPAVVAAAAVVPPRLIRAPRVDYPALARRHRRTAVVEVELTVNAEGKVTAADRVGPPAGLGFDEAAREAAFSARFAPGTRGGVPVEMKTRLTVRFEL